VMSFALPTFVASALALGVALVQFSTDARNTEASVQASVQDYRTFMEAGRLHFAAASAPASTTVYRWSAIRNSAPGSMRDVNMPPSWRYVRQSNGEWVACTQMPEFPGARTGVLTAPGRDGAVQTVHNGTVQYVVHTTAVLTGTSTITATAATLASLCHNNP